MAASKKKPVQARLASLNDKGYKLRVSPPHAVTGSRCSKPRRNWAGSCC